MGGRGSSFSSGKKSTNHFQNSERHSYDFDEDLHASSLNTGKRNQSINQTLQNFRAKHATARREYGAVVDEQGYTLDYRKGHTSSVAVDYRKGKNVTIIHNHPSGSNFSGADLKLTASQKNVKGVVATTSKNGSFQFEKTPKFKAQAFEKALDSIKITKGGVDNYNKQLSDWLKKNAKKYGYKYSHNPSGAFDF